MIKARVKGKVLKSGLLSCIEKNKIIHESIQIPIAWLYSLKQKFSNYENFCFKETK